MKKLYFDYSRTSLIQKIAQTEKHLSNKELNNEIKYLYYKRYVNLLDTLSEKIKQLH